MRIPRTLIIRGKKWTVRRTAGLRKRYGALGLCEYHRRLIQIDSSQSREDQEVTLLHEILHAVFPNSIVGERTEEAIVGGLDEALYAVLKKNKL